MAMAIYDGTAFQIIGISTAGWDYVHIHTATLATGTFAFPHGLGAVPTKQRVMLSTTAQTLGSIALNAEIPLDQAFYSGGDFNAQCSYFVDGTNVNVNVANVSLAIFVSTTLTALTAANFTLKMYASL